MSLEMFIMKCLKYDNTPDMYTIVNKKVKKHYHACDPVYITSETFKKLLQTRMEQIDKDPRNLHVYIKEVVDELKLRQKKEPPQKKIKLDTDSSENSNLEKPAKEESEFQERAVKKLSKLLHCLQKKITKLEQKEVDWDEENDSTYIQLQRYKERAVAVYKKLQQYECGVIPKLQEKKVVTYSGTAFPTINRAIEKYVNKTGQFPDYQEVLKLLKSVYEEEKMSVSPERVAHQAKAAFQTIGEQLQRQRQFSAWNAHSYYLADNRDPAEEDQELDKKLRENKKEFGNRISEIINKFADQTKDVVPEEVGDNEVTSKSENEEDDDSEEDTVDGSERENSYVDEILTGMDNDENGTSESEEDSNEDSNGSLDGEKLQTEETECMNNNENGTSETKEDSKEDNSVGVCREELKIEETECNYKNSKQTEKEEEIVELHKQTSHSLEEIVEIHEQTPHDDKDNTVEFLAEVERTKSDETCGLLQESPKRGLKENVLVTTISVKVEASCKSKKSCVTVPNVSPERRRNGLMQKCEQSKNVKSAVHSYESKQDQRHLTTHSEIDNDSDNDVIILE